MITLLKNRRKGLQRRFSKCTLATRRQTAHLEAPPDRFLQTYLAKRQLQKKEN